jgi:hypothetical protein
MSIEPDIPHGPVLTWLEQACPEVAEYGTAWTWLVILAPTAVYWGQAIYAYCRLFSPAIYQQVNKFYSGMIVFNISAMAIVTWRMNLCMDPPIPPWTSDTFHTATTPVTVMTFSLLVLFPTHTVNNVCRVIFDVWGEEAAKKWIVPAWFTQGWLVVAARMGMLYGKVFFILTLTDYAQHMAGAAYWTYVRCKVIQRERECACLWGVSMHCVSILPILAYAAELLPQTTVSHWLCIIWMIVAMAISQFNWIKVAELTPPSGFTSPGDKSPTVPAEPPLP